MGTLDVSLNEIKSLRGFNSTTVFRLIANENKIEDFKHANFLNVIEANFKYNSITSIEGIDFKKIEDIDFSNN